MSKDFCAPCKSNFVTFFGSLLKRQPRESLILWNRLSSFLKTTSLNTKRKSDRFVMNGICYNNYTVYYHNYAKLVLVKGEGWFCRKKSLTAVIEAYELDTKFQLLRDMLGVRSLFISQGKTLNSVILLPFSSDRELITIK